MSGMIDSRMSDMLEKQWVYRNLYCKAHRTLCTMRRHNRDNPRHMHRFWPSVQCSKLSALVDSPHEDLAYSKTFALRVPTGTAYCVGGAADQWQMASNEMKPCVEQRMPGKHL
ncbi:hypothetical protein BS47DRAFT_1393910 [Hydnum rufescens UP504]|uniref:Uncharacterized protein n=1 Tax=Hydnum rufescens UP504 TaxID=1448309 RepID=A0A9P6AVE6_9AGAM|nr:hypothetical protein BS47DRAFT_1393910 [Hydnum rufescens UP504]